MGVDACRFFFLSRSHESQMEFDLELAKEESAENPVYYVQYAHARIASILRLAQEREIDYSDGRLSLLNHEAELALIRRMLLLPELVETMAHTLEPHHLPTMPWSLPRPSTGSISSAGWCPACPRMRRSPGRG